MARDGSRDAKHSLARALKEPFATESNLLCFVGHTNVPYLHEAGSNALVILAFWGLGREKGAASPLRANARQVCTLVSF